MNGEKTNMIEILLGTIPEPGPDVGELEACIQRMRIASNEFYKAAVRTGCHPFIEFTGFMNEYIKIAEKAAQKGIDFRNLNTHSGQALPLETYEAKYLGEKFDCIFGPSIRESPAIHEAFLSSLKP